MKIYGKNLIYFVFRKYPVLFKITEEKKRLIINGNIRQKAIVYNINFGFYCNSKKKISVEI